MVNTSYSTNDVVVLLKDLTGQIETMETKEREAKIQSGVHYSELLPQEFAPSKEYLSLYNESVQRNKGKVAEGIGILAEKLYKKHGDKLVLISLARAGLPVGILIKRYLKAIYKIEVPHYGISIIRGKGIDINAMQYIYEKEKSVEHFQFIDGWTGKGAIAKQLIDAVKTLKEANKYIWDTLSPDLAVLADPAKICTISGTQEDFLLPTSCLNSTVSGLTSRTILNKSVCVEKGDFHGAVYFSEFEKQDLSLDFLDIITKEFKKQPLLTFDIPEMKNKVVSHLQEVFSISDINKIKPGIGETTRVLLRRIPWAVIINDEMDEEILLQDEDIQPIFRLCKEKNIPIKKANLGNYKVCGIIKEKAADA